MKTSPKDSKTILGSFDRSKIPTNRQKEFSFNSLWVDRISSLVWIALGSIVIYNIRDLEYLDEYGPRGGFLPFWLGVILIVLGAALFLKTVIPSAEIKKISFTSKTSAIRIFSVLAGYFGFVLFIEKVGFYISCGFLFIFLLFFVEKLGWKFTVSAALIATLTLWLLFEVLFNVGLPSGILSWHYLKYRWLAP